MMTTIGCSEAIRLLSGSALMSLMSSVAADVEIEARARTTFSRLAEGGKVARTVDLRLRRRSCTIRSVAAGAGEHI